ncbi:transglutaminase domain-containing protein [Butyrivibrio sp. WCD2001]|uniref:transglutaminase domain-containing protein n=1 Tax=Butyrivibrio sp. WCD2001 TaxID=1280681 RepID=UPI0004011947|nr:transglutaminase domain-containing protein [Butyrivibrio sp. WCD2001]
MRILENIAYGLMGLVFACLAFILACVVNPDIGVWVGALLQPADEEEVQVDTSNKYYVEVPDWDYIYGNSEETDSHDVESEENSSSGLGDMITNAVTGISDAIAELEATEVDNPADNDVTVEDVANAADAMVDVLKGKGIHVVVESDDNKTKAEDTVSSDGSDNAEAVAYAPGVPVGKSGYAAFDPEIIELDDEGLARQAINSVDYGDLGEGLTFDSQFYPYYNMLSEEGKSLYRQIYANTRALNPAFRPVQQVTMDTMQMIIMSVVLDHPELFWLDTTFYQEYDYQGVAVKLRLRYYDKIKDIPSANSQFLAAADQIVAGASGLPDDLSKEVYIHNLLAEKLNYKHNPLDQSAYSAIVGNDTVCAGYAKAFQYLMQRLGVPTYLCAGYAGQMHAWNIIKLGDNYYNVDVTWDDQDPTVYDYFNLSDRDNYNHKRMYNSVYLPACNEGVFIAVAD